MNETQMIALLEDMVKKSSSSKVAKELGITPQYLFQLRKGQRGISHAISKKLGYKMVVEKTTVKTFLRIL